MSQWDGVQFFGGTLLSQALAARAEKMRKTARDWSADEVLATSETDIVNYLVKTHPGVPGTGPGRHRGPRPV